MSGCVIEALMVVAGVAVLLVRARGDWTATAGCLGGAVGRAQGTGDSGRRFESRQMLAVYASNETLT